MCGGGQREGTGGGEWWQAAGAPEGELKRTWYLLGSGPCTVTSFCPPSHRPTQAQEAVAAPAQDLIAYSLPSPLHEKARAIYQSRCYGVTFDQVDELTDLHVTGV